MNNRAPRRQPGAGKRLRLTPKLPAFLRQASSVLGGASLVVLSTIAFREKRNFQRAYIQQQKLWERWETSEPREPFSKRCVKRGKTPERGGQLLPCRFL